MARKNLNFLILPELPKPAGSLRAQSISHPDMMKWYRSKDIDLAWTVSSAQKYEVLVGLDALPRGVATQSVQDRNVRLQAPRDGVWYAHVQVTYADGKQEQVDLPVRVDTTQPSPIQPVIEAMLTEKGMERVLRFSALDNLSGMRGYDVFLNEFLVTSTAMTSVTLGALKPGDWMVRVVGADVAGNTREASFVYHVSSPLMADSLPQVVEGGWSWWWIWLFLLLLLLILSWMWAVRQVALPKPQPKPFRKKKK